MAPPGREKLGVFWKISRNRAHITEVRPARALSLSLFLTISCSVAREKPLLRRILGSGPVRSHQPAGPSASGHHNRFHRNPAGRTAAIAGASGFRRWIIRRNVFEGENFSHWPLPDEAGYYRMDTGFDSVLLGRKIRPDGGLKHDTLGGDSRALETRVTSADQRDPWPLLLADSRVVDSHGTKHTHGARWRGYVVHHLFVLLNNTQEEIGVLAV